MITVLGPVLLSDGRPFIGRMRLEPLWTPTSLPGEAALNNVLTVNANAPDGLWNDYNGGNGLQLAAGEWKATFPSAPGSSEMLVEVPDGPPTTQVAIMDLIGPADAPLSTPGRLVAMVAGEEYQLTAINYDADGVVTTATVLWPDGSAGVFTRTLKNQTFLVVDAFTITHANSGQTVTQAAVTRDANGNVIVQPELTVS